MPLPVLSVAWRGRLAIRDILLPQAPALLAAGVMGGAVALLRMQLAPHMSDLGTLSVLIAVGATLYPILLIITTTPRRAAQILRQLGSPG